MTHFSGEPDREQQFRTLYAAVYPDLLRFVRRRADADRAEDIVADTFLVVWRRVDEVPPSAGDARAWIFGISRNILLNNGRGERRNGALGLRLAEAADLPASTADIDLATRRIDVARAWRMLSETHQETLGLAVFEDLSGPQAAAVLGVSPVAYRLRLSRARRALRLLLDHLPASSASPGCALSRQIRSASVTVRLLGLFELPLLQDLEGEVRDLMTGDPHNPNSHSAAQGVIENLFASLGVPDKKAALAGEVVSLVEQDPRITSVRDLCTVLGLQERTLERLCARFLGVSPRWVIRQRRLQEAGVQIRAGTSLAELSAQLGYTDQPHFSRDFRAATGWTPGEFAGMVQGRTGTEPA